MLKLESRIAVAALVLAWAAVHGAPAPALAQTYGCVPASPADTTGEPDFAPETDEAAVGPMGKLHHLVVIYLENHSFDNLYGWFAGANGLASAGLNNTQRDLAGNVYATLPQTLTSPFPGDLPNKPFPIEAYVPAKNRIPDLVHRFYQEQAQIDGGKMDHFAAVSDAKGEVMGYYQTSGLPIARLAESYTLCDNFFHAAFGGSFLNHLWLVAAATPRFEKPTRAMIAQLDGAGNLLKDGEVTPDSFAVNTIMPMSMPHPDGVKPSECLCIRDLPTIGDRLSERRVSWVWYSGGWDRAMAGQADPLFQFHHQPFAYFARYAAGMPENVKHLKDENDFIAAIKSGRLPAVSFVKPLGPDNEHPGYADMVTGEKHVIYLLCMLQNSPLWKNTAVLITYDEHGGLWDHVAPPKVDRWGPGSRVPSIVISPFAKRHHVDHTLYDTTSILAFIEKRWQVKALNSRDLRANPLSGAFDFAGSGASATPEPDLCSP